MAIQQQSFASQLEQAEYEAMLAFEEDHSQCVRRNPGRRGYMAKHLRFIVHWKGGVHTQFERPRTLVPQGLKTATDDVEVIRKMAARYGDDDIVRVLNNLGQRTKMGTRWSLQRVARVRSQHMIAGRSHLAAEGL